MQHQNVHSDVTEDDGSITGGNSRLTGGPGRRRVVLMGAAAGLGAAGAAAVVAGCGSGSTAPGTTSPASESAGSGPASPGATSSPAAGSGGALAKLSDVPVGGAFAAAGPGGTPIIIAQPQAGTVVAFSAACTHKGCKVVPEGKILNCPCHQSTFDPFTGKNLSGPAPAPLPPVAVKVSGTDIVAG